MHDRFYKNFGTHTGFFIQHLKPNKETPTMNYKNYINHLKYSKNHKPFVQFTQSYFIYRHHKKKIIQQSNVQKYINQL